MVLDDSAARKQPTAINPDIMMPPGVMAETKPSPSADEPVSYTHLTLPTNREV